MLLLDSLLLLKAMNAMDLLYLYIYIYIYINSQKIKSTISSCIYPFGFTHFTSQVISAQAKAKKEAWALGLSGVEWSEAWAYDYGSQPSFQNLETPPLREAVLPTFTLTLFMCKLKQAVIIKEKPLPCILSLSFSPVSSKTLLFDLPDQFIHIPHT